MAITTPSFEDIVNSFIENLKSKVPEAATTPNSVIREALINSPAVQISSLFDLSKRIATLQNVFLASGNDLDNLGSSYGISRKGGQKSSGIIYVDLTALNTRTEITIPSGTLVSGRRGSVNGVTFSVIGDHTFSYLNRAIYEASASALRDQLDSVGLSKVSMIASIPISANSVGTVGNVGLYTLTNLSVSGSSQCINISAITGGSNAESDASFRTRIMLVFSGNSVGTENGLLSAALATAGVQGGFIILPGDPLMTRDGTIRDQDGNIITPGSNRSVDIYIQGTQLDSQSENVIFIQNNTTNFLSTQNAIEIGSPTVEGEFGTTPIFSMSSITGQSSGASFSEAIPITDEEGNILLEGNFALIKDVEAENYYILENLVTRERRLATYVNPLTTKYTIIEQFEQSDFANSALSKDKIIFLKNKVDVTEEEITRGIYNGADSLRFENITNVKSAFEKKEILDNIKVSTFTEVAGGIVLTVNHSPILELIRITNTRLGIDYSGEIYNSAEGQIKISGRVLPKADDILQVEYVWQKEYVENLNYNLTGDLVNWIGYADEQSVNDNSLLVETNLASTFQLDRQPNIATHLEMQVNGLSDREVVEIQIDGTAISFTNNELALRGSDPFILANTSAQNIGKIFKVSNLTQGFNYNLAGYQLATNKFDRTIAVDSTLLGQQFKLNQAANEQAIDVGDYVVLARPSRIISLSTQEDFQNNIDDNLAPIYDPTKLEFSSGGILLSTPLKDSNTTPTILSGTLTQDLVLSGIVEITDDVIIAEGVLVDIQPNTTIKVRSSDQLDQQIYKVDNVNFDPTLTQDQTLGTPSLPYEEYFYIYFQLEDYVSTSFSIINDEGRSIRIRFESDILKKTVVGTIVTFYLNNLQVPFSFNQQLESTLNKNDIASSIKATLLGARTGVGGSPQFISHYISSKEAYYVLLEKTPIITSDILSDFSLLVTADQSLSFERITYNPTINALVCDGDIVTIDGYGEISEVSILNINQITIESDTRLELTLNSVVGIAENFTIKQEFYDSNQQIESIAWSKILSVDSLSNKVILEFIDNFTDSNPLNKTVIIDSSTSDPTLYSLLYFTEEKRKLAITVDGTLRTLGTSPQASVLFTSMSSNALAGDWEGIVFTLKSHSSNSQTRFQSNLKNCRIRYASSGISINASDVNVQNSIIQECSDVGISISSTLQSYAGFVDDNYQLLNSPQNSEYHNYPYGQFLKNQIRPSFTSSEGLSIARFAIPENLVTSQGLLPSLRQKLNSEDYVIELQYGVDYRIYLDGQEITKIDSSVPSDQIADHTLIPYEDFQIEYSIKTGYSLVFFYTANTSRLRRVYNLIADFNNISRLGNLTLDLYASMRNGLIYDNLITKCQVGVTLGDLSTVSINRNTIDGTRVGINIKEAITSLANNLITDFQQSGIITNSKALVEARRNNIYSQIIVDQNNLAIADTDLLLRNIDELQITIYVRTPQKFKIGSVIKIDSEEMLVQGANTDSIIVKRGYNNSRYQKHTSGTPINIFQFNQIFSVTGIPGESCQVIETDSNGFAVQTGVPIQMRQVASQTFRVALPTNRRGDFYYRYRFTSGTSIKETKTKVFLRSRPGIGVNDIYSIYHELPLSVGYTANMENLSVDPFYTNKVANDFSYSKVSSLCSKDNPIYQSLSVPNDTHRYVGFIEVRNNKVLIEGTTRIPVFAEPLVIESLENEVSIIPIGNTNYTYNARQPIGFTTTITEDEANQGAIGVLLLVDPITFGEAGEFQIRYRRAVDLGTTIPPYYIESQISYIFDVGQDVIFDKLQIRKDDIGGIIQTTFSVADSLDTLSQSVTSDQSTDLDFELQGYGENQGSVIQINLKLLGNDSSYNNQLNYIYPLLRDFSLIYTPGKDQQEYQIISMIRDYTQDRTNLLLSAPISTQTFNTVGQDPICEVYLKKATSNEEYLIALCDQVSIGQTSLAGYGDLITKKSAPLLSDVVRVDYLSYSNQSESLYFVEDQTLITQNLFSNILEIRSIITKDKRITIPSIEKITILNTNQPSPQDSYFINYQFEAPVEGETLAIDYVYNSLIRNTSQEVESRKSIFTDVQVRQVKAVPVVITVDLEVQANIQSPLSVRTAVGTAITNLFNEFTDITSERRLDSSDIIRATGGIDGIEEITVTTLSRDGVIGEIKTLIFEKRENPTLNVGSPQISTTQNGKVIG